MKRNWKNILAWGSLALNVILVAIILVGPHRFHPHPPGPPSPEKMFSRMGHDLIGTDKTAFDRILKKHIPAMKNSGDDMHRALQSIGAIVKTEPFSIDNVRQAHNVLHSRREQMDAAIEGFIYELLDELSAEGRQKLKFGPPPSPKK